MADERLELPQGTLDLLILKSLGLEPLHGWAISERLQQISHNALQVQQGSLYRPCTAWSAAAGFRPDGPLRRTTGGQNTTS